MSQNQSRFLIMTSVEAEREAILRGIKEDPRFDVILAGVGPVSAGIQTTKALISKKYDLVINMGIAGGFVGRAEVGTLVVADCIVSSDLGAESPGGFIPLDELGFGSSTRVEVDTERIEPLLNAFSDAGISVQKGTILTLSTVTGTEETTSALLLQEPDAVAEAMEGYGIAMAAEEFGVQVMEIRAISNPIGPRDRSAWRIKDAFATLERASKVIAEVL